MFVWTLDSVFQAVFLSLIALIGLLIGGLIMWEKVVKWWRKS